jgi:hypothetical protein
VEAGAVTTTLQAGDPWPTETTWNFVYNLGSINNARLYKVVGGNQGNATYINITQGVQFSIEGIESPIDGIKIDDDDNTNIFHIEKDNDGKISVVLANSFSNFTVTLPPVETPVWPDLWTAPGGGAAAGVSAIVVGAQNNTGDVELIAGDNIFIGSGNNTITINATVPEAVNSLNTLQGAVTLLQGTGINLGVDQENREITISATGGAGVNEIMASGVSLTGTVGILSGGGVNISVSGHDILLSVPEPPPPVGTSTPNQLLYNSGDTVAGAPILYNGNPTLGTMYMNTARNTIQLNRTQGDFVSDGSDTFAFYGQINADTGGDDKKLGTVAGQMSGAGGGGPFTAAAMQFYTVAAASGVSGVGAHIDFYTRGSDIAGNTLDGDGTRRMRIRNDGMISFGTPGAEYTFPTTRGNEGDVLVLGPDPYNLNWVAQGGSGNGVTSVNSISGAVTVTGSNGVTVSESGNTITINGGGGGGGVQLFDYPLTETTITVDSTFKGGQAVLRHDYGGATFIISPSNISNGFWFGIKLERTASGYTTLKLNDSSGPSGLIYPGDLSIVSYLEDTWRIDTTSFA